MNDMEEKLVQLYNECIVELNSIGISIKECGRIDISIAKRNAKRYGCCKQEEPDKKTRYKEKGKIKYYNFNVHHIEISKWVMQLNDKIIKNTIMHELIHCFPYCNNHGQVFKEYSKVINQKLGYDISRVGNREEDYKNSNVDYKEELIHYNYKIVCMNCGYVYYRQRCKKYMVKKYRCGICKGKLKIIGEN